MKGNKDLNSSSPHHHLSLSLRTSRNHQTTKTNLIILSTPGMLQPRKKRRSLTRFIPLRLESSSQERLWPTLLVIRGSSCTGWRPLRWLINWRKPSLPSVKTILYWEKKITFFSAELSVSEGMADQFEIIEMDDETYSGILVYKPFGDFTTLPMMSC